MLDHFDQAITTLLIGTNILHLTIATLVTVVVQRQWGMWAVTAGTLVTTVVVFFAGEMLPKSIAKKYAERLAMRTARSPLKARAAASSRRSSGGGMSPTCRRSRF